MSKCQAFYIDESPDAIYVDKRGDIFYSHGFERIARCCELKEGHHGEHQCTWTTKEPIDEFSFAVFSNKLNWSELTNEVNQMTSCIIQPCV